MPGEYRLWRYHHPDETELKSEYIVLEAIYHLQGEQGQQRFIDQVPQDGIEPALILPFHSIRRLVR
ncbi:MAG: DUF3400 domain-containing protein [Candidatus Thiodiazotropha endolucinida]